MKTLYVLVLLALAGTASAQEPPTFELGHTITNGGGRCTERLTCKFLGTDEKSKLSFILDIGPDGHFTDGDLFEELSDGTVNSVRNLSGTSNLPAKLKVGNYQLTASFTGQAFEGVITEWLHVGQENGHFIIIVLHGELDITTIQVLDDGRRELALAGGAQ